MRKKKEKRQNQKYIDEYYAFMHCLFTVHTTIEF